MEIITLSTLTAILATAPTTAQPPGPGSMVVPMVVMIVLFYFLMIRPQSVKMKQHKALLEALKVGDKVVTNGGILGVVVSIKDNTISMRSADSKFEIQKSAVAALADAPDAPK